MQPDPRIINSDRMEDGVIVTFDDGKCALFSASLLHGILSQAEILPNPDQSEQDD